MGRHDQNKMWTKTSEFIIMTLNFDSVHFKAHIKKAIYRSTTMKITWCATSFTYYFHNVYL